MKEQKPYMISQDKQSGMWYCHKRGYKYIPVFGSIGKRAQAAKIRDIYNRSKGY